MLDVIVQEQITAVVKAELDKRMDGIEDRIP